MSSPNPHAFRYERALCTLPEGGTLADWRRDGAAENGSAPRRGGLVARLRAARPGVRRLSVR